MIKWFCAVIIVALLAGCNLDVGVTTTTGTDGGTTGGSAPANGELARVVSVVDGDTIRVEINGQEVPVRYVGVNTPERDEPCYTEATNFNRSLVEGHVVTLVRDTSDTDRYDRLLRYVYYGNTFVNEALVADGYAEAVLYEPDDEYFDHFRTLERQAAASGLGCHPTGIFNDSNDRR
ncbi:MAG: thermonuclease family protein [Anaerolineaceae bacterium]|nr:thermonuclease family protein [Anaerolineaceae bacterium]